MERARAFAGDRPESLRAVVDDRGAVPGLLQLVIGRARYRAPVDVEVARTQQVGVRLGVTGEAGRHRRRKDHLGALGSAPARATRGVAGLHPIAVGAVAESAFVQRQVRAAVTVAPCAAVEIALQRVAGGGGYARPADRVAAGGIAGRRGQAGRRGPT